MTSSFFVDWSLQVVTSVIHLGNNTTSLMMMTSAQDASQRQTVFSLPLANSTDIFVSIALFVPVAMAVTMETLLS